MRHEYECYLAQGQLPIQHESKILYLLREALSLGNAIALFEMLHYFRQALTQELVLAIQEKAFTGLKNAPSPHHTRCYGELVAKCAVEDEEICQYFVSGLLEGTVDCQLALFILESQAESGMVYMLQLAERNIGQLSLEILQFLSNTPSVIQRVII